MNLNDPKIVVAIENAVCDQLEASGITADPFRLDGEKIIDAILEQLGDFVLVKNVHPDSIVHNQGLSLFKECQVIYGWNGKSKDFKDALNKGFYHGVKLGVKAVLETAMIKVQEQTND